MYRGRFAPSPTGWLHLGNARTALTSWWRARTNSGKFVLRIDDLDDSRTVPETILGNLDELRWLGIDWDEGPDIGGPNAPYRQSQRNDRYEAALQLLKSNGLTFPCFLSRKDLRALSSAPHGQPILYGATERQANSLISPQNILSGKLPNTRLRISDSIVSFMDVIAGKQSVSAMERVGDILIRRADGAWAYHFATVLDDTAMGITEVVRGDDLFSSTPTQIIPYKELGRIPPLFAHVPLVRTAEGKRMSKRTGSLTLRSLRQAGVPANRIVGLLSFSLGLIEKPKPVSAIDLLPYFDINRIKPQPFSLSDAHLTWLTTF